MNRLTKGIALAILIAGAATVVPVTADAAAVGAPAIAAPGDFAGHPNFNGFWIPVREGGRRVAFAGGWDGPGPNPPPLTKWALDYVKDYKAREAAGTTISGPSAQCQPKGFPYNMEHTLPMDFLQRPDELVILVEERSFPRHIYMDGRKHIPEEDLVPSSNGDSIGHWEGDTLVVDTIGIDDTTLLTIDRIPHSDKLHIVERISLSPDKQFITDVLTLEDPKTFVSPWVMPLKYQRGKPGTAAMEYPCVVDDSRNKDDNTSYIRAK